MNQEVEVKPLSIHDLRGMFVPVVSALTDFADNMQALEYCVYNYREGVGDDVLEFLSELDENFSNAIRDIVAMRKFIEDGVYTNENGMNLYPVYSAFAEGKQEEPE